MPVISLDVLELDLLLAVFRKIYFKDSVEFMREQEKNISQEEIQSLLGIYCKLSKIKDLSEFDQHLLDKINYIAQHNVELTRLINLADKCNAVKLNWVFN